MSVVTTVLVSASVSGLVALGIEYAAKPRLEARKEVLLDLHRKRRELSDMLLKILTLSQMWAPVADGTGTELDSELARAFQQLDLMTSQLWDDIERYAGTFASVRVLGHPPLRDLVLRYIFGVRAVYLSDRPRADALRILGELTEPLQVALSARWWQPMRRGRAFAQMPAVLDKYAPAETANP